MLSRVILSVLLLCSPVFAERTIVTRSPYLYNPYNNTQNYNYQNRIFSDLNDLEMYVFDKTYCSENNLARLNRLEEAVFGTYQQGDIYNRYENVKNAIFARPKQNYKTSFLQNLSNYFAGQMTGYTPNIYQNNYPSMYGNNSFVNFSGPQGRGYRYNNNGIGNSSSFVRILD